AEGVVYTTEGGPGHEHEVRLDAAMLQRLLRNERITVETSEVASPDPHHHRFDLQDRLGLWGAPPTLVGDSGWWPSPPFAASHMLTRANVEILNMPAKFLSMHVAPPPGRVRPLYVCTTAVPEDEERLVVYPWTADGQPAVVVAKADESSTRYSRAY